MNLPGFFSPTWAYLFFLVIPLVIFYFLKLRRTRLEVPSLLLWRQVLNDQRVNSPFQKFKRNLLLLLQLLLLIMAILAAMQPFRRGDEERFDRLPIMIDSSASMAAIDRNTGRSMLQLAKNRAHELVDSILPDQRFCVISFSNRARKLCDFTDNRKILHQYIDDIKIDDQESNLEEALNLVSAISQGVTFKNAYLFSDGNFPNEIMADVTYKLIYERIEGAVENIGITTLSASLGEGAVWRVLVVLEGNNTGGGELTLRKNGSFLERETVSVTKDEPERLEFDIDTAEDCTVEFRLKPQGQDALESDNVAYIELKRPRALQIYVDPDLATYQNGFEALDNVEIHEDVGATAKFDIAVCASEKTKNIKSNVKLNIGIVPDDLKGVVTINEGGTEVVDWRRRDRLLRYMELGDLVILDNPVTAVNRNFTDYELAGFEIIANGRKGPLVLRKENAELTEYDFLFHTDRSTLPYKVGFPIMIANLTDIAWNNSGLSTNTASRTGTISGIKLEKNSPYMVEAPDGKTVNIKSDSSGFVNGIPAPLCGKYRITGAGEEKELYASLLSRNETLLVGADKVQIQEVSVTMVDTAKKRDKPLWGLCLVLGLLSLFAEWWYYQRCPGGYGRMTE